MEATGEEETLTIGKFVFSKAAFDKAIQIIHNAITKEGWLIIDEIGPLELKGEGFCDVLKEVLIQRNNKLLLVLREGLLQPTKEYFGIGTVTVMGVNEISSVL